MSTSLVSDPLSFASFPFIDNDSSLAFPSPPPSVIHSEKDPILKLDIDSVEYSSPHPTFSLLESLDDPTRSVEASPVTSSCTPTSFHLVSPKTVIADVASTNQTSSFQEEPGDPDTAEALSNHHLQRYLYYRGLAAKAEADRAAELAKAQTIENDQQLESFFAPSAKSDIFMSGADHIAFYKDNTIPQNSDEMLAYQSQQFNAPSYYGVSQAGSNWAQPAQSFNYHPHSSQAALHNAQAQAHLQAADAARFQAQQQRSMSMSSYYMGDNARASFDAQQGLNVFPRQSISTGVSVQSPPYPSTPTYASVPNVVGQHTTKSATSSSLPSFAIVGPSPGVRRAHSHESVDESEDELAEYSPRGYSVEDVKPIVSGVSVTNAHGGGRGYVPGQTPDDPKKKHRCQICGRGFARAFNLKSHVQTHNPLRPKPHQCPHASCKRGFSRLHDLERHRQGIHSDGPLVEAKRQGVAPAIARAQGRIQKRAETGSLI